MTFTPPPSDQPPGPQVNLTGSTSGPLNVAGRDVVTGNVVNVAAGATVVIGAQARQGMQALNELIQVSPQVRAAVITFGDRFQSATTGVEIMGDYKELHDLLHQVQYQVYALVVREAASFPAESSLEVLDEYARNLRDILVHLRSVIALARVQAAERAWVEDLATAQAELRTCVERQDPTILRAALGRMKSILSTRPVRINSRLVSAAESLNLSMLLTTLESIRLGLVDLPVEVERLEQFRNGLLAFKTLETSLNQLLAAHEAWQDLDFELRQVDSMLELSLDDLDFSWQIIKEKVDPLIQDIQEAWAQDISNYRQKLDKVIPTREPEKIRQAFRNFRHESGSHFYKVDHDLNTLCGELRKVGEPLAAIVRSLA